MTRLVLPHRRAFPLLCSALDHAEVDRMRDEIVALAFARRLVGDRAPATYSRGVWSCGGNVSAATQRADQRRE